MEPEIDARIQNAWRLRREGRMEAFLESVLVLRREAGKEAGGRPPEEIAGVFLLSSSLSRFQGDLGKAHSWARDASAVLARHGLKEPFELHFQKALNFFAESDYALALESFLPAVSAAENPVDEAYARMNCLLCHENLGFPFDEAWKETTALLSSLPRSPETSDVRAQAEAMKSRLAFRSGTLKGAARRGQELDQAAYHRLWMAQLPYHSGYDPVVKNSLRRMTTQAPHLPHRAFRLRTLAVLTHPDDASYPKRSELADRLYLWVWKWLVEGERFPVQRITATLALIKEVPLHQWTVEDVFLIRNALSWLELFDPIRPRGLSSMLAKLNRPGLEAFSPLLHFEHLITCYLRALRDRRQVLAQDSLESLKMHPLAKSRDLHLKDIFRALSSGGRRGGGGSGPVALSSLISNLAPLLGGDAPSEASQAGLRVDLGLMQITSFPSGRKVESEPIAVALRLLQRHGSVAQEELLKACFGIPRFDSTIHSMKIFNLVSRLKAIAPAGLRFRVKTGLVISEGAWSRVAFIEPDGMSLALRADADWRALHEQPRAEDAAPPPAGAGTDERGAKGVLLGDRIRRRELEKLIGKSRATANRVLAEWVRLGWIRRQGGSRQASYVIGPQARRLLENGGSSETRRSIS